MKREAIIPLEILKVEDKILANLSASQIALLAPAVLISLLLIFVQPIWQITFLKLVIFIASWLFLGPLAIRINGYLVFKWLILRIQYSRRPLAYIKGDQLKDEVKF